MYKNKLFKIYFNKVNFKEFYNEWNFKNNIIRIIFWYIWNYIMRNIRNSHQKKFNKKQQKYASTNDLLKTGIIVSIGLAIAICLHDIPEGRLQSRQYAR